MVHVIIYFRITATCGSRVYPCNNSGGCNRPEDAAMRRLPYHARPLLPGCTNNFGATPVPHQFASIGLGSKVSSFLTFRVLFPLSFPTTFFSLVFRSTNDSLWRSLISYLAPPNLGKTSKIILARTPPPRQAYPPHSPTSKTSDCPAYCRATLVRLVALPKVCVLLRSSHLCRKKPHHTPNNPLRSSKTSWTRSARAITRATS